MRSEIQLLGGKRLYLVDADQHTRRSRVVMLKTHGYDITSTESLPGSIPFADAQTDLVLLASGAGRNSWVDQWRRIKSAAPGQRIVVLPYGSRLCAMFSEGVEVSPQRELNDDLPALVRAALTS